MPAAHTDSSTEPAIEARDDVARILQIIEARQRRQWAEILSAIVLSLAALGSAWCAYQSNLWGGVQSFHLADAARAAREASRLDVEAVELRAVDVTMLLHFVQAHFRGDQAARQFLLDRFRGPMKPAVDAWLATDPFTNPSAAPSPFHLPEYVQPGVTQARQFAEESQRLTAAAQTANGHSDRYVLMTVLFASVLFFGGIGGTFESRRLRMTMGLLALSFFVVTTVVMLRLPICNE